ncbi:MAG: hypothetical protein IGS39_01910 [Calothrix sp. C42_A2020_038]|nr:hypothetical protein [Calothrix sp. C42_A2020_038]
MLGQIFYSIQVNGKKIDWERLSGYALGVQKYTTTYVRGSGDSVRSEIETITEFWIKQSGKEVHVKISSERIRVRNGQKVSVLSCYNNIRLISNCIFINHDFQEWHWLCKSWNFFKNLEIFKFLTDWFFANLIIGGVWIIIWLIVVLQWVNNEFIVALLMTLAFVGLVSFVVQLIVMSILIHLHWKQMQPQVEAMVNSIL